MTTAIWGFLKWGIPESPWSFHVVSITSHGQIWMIWCTPILEAPYMEKIEWNIMGHITLIYQQQDDIEVHWTCLKIGACCQNVFLGCPWMPYFNTKPSIEIGPWLQSIGPNSGIDSRTMSIKFFTQNNGSEFRGQALP